MQVPLTLVLDHLRSSFNVGSIFRTAECLGVSRVVLCGYTATPDEPQAQQPILQQSSLCLTCTCIPSLIPSLSLILSLSLSLSLSFSLSLSLSLSLARCSRPQWERMPTSGGSGLRQPRLRCRRCEHRGLTSSASRRRVP